MTEIDPLAARQSRTPCPECGKTGTMTLGRKLRANPIGSFSLAGAQMKVSARDVDTITCDPDVGGCGWSADGVYDADYHHFITDQPAA